LKKTNEIKKEVMENAAFGDMNGSL